MKHFFTEDNRWTPEGRDFSLEVFAALEPIITRWKAEGWSPREIFYMVSAEALEQTLS